jgi:putative ABC transport system substrate-binding protein
VLGVQIHPSEIAKAEDLASAFAGFGDAGFEAVVLLQSPAFRRNNARIAKLALEAKLPEVGGESGFAAVGGLMNFSASIPENWARAADYVMGILKGSKPAELPVEQPAKYEPVVNLRTARELGIAIPAQILARADESSK